MSHQRGEVGKEKKIKYCMGKTFLFQLSMTFYACVCYRWVFVHEKAYQVRDTAIESSVMTKVKGFGVYNDKVMDVADYVTPTQVWMDGWMD